jgi:hypothetical protein
MAVTLDVNEFGLRMQTTEPFEVGSRNRFNIALEEDVIHALGRIVHVCKALNGTYEIGVEFLEITAGEIEKIRAYISRKAKT